MDHANEPGAPGGQVPAGASAWRAPEQGAAAHAPHHHQRPDAPAPAGSSPYAPPPPWAQQPQPVPRQPQPVAPWLAEPQGNPAAVWSWVAAVPCAPLGLALGVVGLVRARRRGGAGFGHAVTGTVLSGVVLLVLGAALAVGAVAGLVALSDDAGPASRGSDGTVESMSPSEQEFIDALYEETYQSYDDATLLDMAYGFCADLDAGRTPAEADTALVERWSDEQLTLDAAYDVEWSATGSLCQQHAEGFQAWDPSANDGTGATTTTTTTTSTTTT